MLLIYTDINTPRVHYTFHLIFTQLLGIAYKITNNVLEFSEYTKESLNYSKKKIRNEIFIERAGLLCGDSIIPIEITPYKRNLQTYLFPSNNADLHYDIFAATFYMVTRYEEYLPAQTDIHDRFKSANSLASKHNFLLQPIVNEWAAEFGALLLVKYPQLDFQIKKFSCILTYDIDVAYTYKGREIIRTLLSILQDIAGFKINRLIERVKVKIHMRPDPSDVYSYIESISTRIKLPVIFFFLVGDLSKYDKNLHYASRTMKELLQRLITRFPIGIHPSYSSSNDVRIIKEEKKRLERITGKIITKSRQHFLKFSLPATFLYLLDAGIKEDYSMGFADAPGFRAGICTPFYFYDLKHEKATELLLFPSAFMDGNFIKYMKTTPSEAIRTISELVQKVRSVNGLFISIWHNDTLSNKGNYLGWKLVHDQMIEQISTSDANTVHE